MTKYYVAVDVLNASGFQTFVCEAESKADALEKFQKGDCDFHSEDVEITDLDFDGIDLSDIGSSE